MSDPLLSLVAVGLLSITCQYLAYKVRLPAILPLLIVGILVGPVFGVLNADDLFGDLLFPVVSLSVAIILFEGSLTLKFSDIAGHGNMVRNLCSVGVVVTWLVAATAAHYSLDLTWQLSFLFGAIVTVTGPTVIVPMLRTVRPKTNLANILRWEGIVIDPIGALLAVLVFEFIVASQETAITHTLIAFGKTIGIGSVLGLASGYLLGLSIRKDWIPHYLLNTAVLTVILGVFAASNYVAHESGLLAVTISGMVLANMKDVDVEDILEFKETLSVLLISGLFILLATRLNLQSVVDVGWGSIVVLAAIMFVARPLSVLASSVGTGLKLNELALLSWIAPRGIVAAAVSALFSLKLEEIGYEGAGTVEFIYEDGKFFFLEMNTRIQVEHPVSEIRGGIDLVKEQIKIASKGKTALKQSDITFRGHVIECRINAEDPSKNFQPSPGTISVCHQPSGFRTRVDGAIFQGCKITPYYDSLICKLICQGRDREEAILRIQRSLGEFVIEGITTTIDLHKKLLSYCETDGTYTIKKAGDRFDIDKNS